MKGEVLTSGEMERDKKASKNIILGFFLLKFTRALCGMRGALFIDWEVGNRRA